MAIKSKKDVERLIDKWGFLPFFRNRIPGFSLAELAHPSVWFPDTGEGVWEWKGPAIRDLGCAYGKFFGRKAAYITREWFLDFANYRRDGYDFDARVDDELAPVGDVYLYGLLALFLGWLYERPSHIRVLDKSLLIRDS